MRALNFLEKIRSSSAKDLISTYFSEEDSAKEILNIEFDSSKSFSTIYNNLKKDNSEFIIGQRILSKNSRRYSKCSGSGVPLWDTNYLNDFI